MIFQQIKIGSSSGLQSVISLLPKNAAVLHDLQQTHPHVGFVVVVDGLVLVVGPQSSEEVLLSVREGMSVMTNTSKFQTTTNMVDHSNPIDLIVESIFKYEHCKQIGRLTFRSSF